MAFNYVSIGAKIRLIRKNRGMTQQELSDRLDICPSFVSHVETGAKTMSLETFVAVANALGVSADELLADNLDNTITLSSHEFTKILSDCSEFERRVLLEVLAATKASIRNNRFYFKRGL